MADYPHYSTIPQGGASRRVPLGTGNISNIAVDGTVRVANFQAVQPYRFELVHSYIPIADADTITAHYAAEAGSAFNFVWAFDDATYVCKYDGVEPRVDPIDGAGTAVANVSVLLVGVKA